MRHAPFKPLLTWSTRFGRLMVACDLRVCTDACDVDKRDFEAALERPELVSTPDVQRQLAFRYRQIHQ